MLNHAVVAEDPLMDVQDRVPVAPSALSVLAEGGSSGVDEVRSGVAVPLGMRLAVYPVRAGEHSKSYETRTETEDTERSDDGKVYTVPDTIRREVEVD